VLGAVDLVSKTTEGIANTANEESVYAPKRLRPPRYFDDSGRVWVYLLSLVVTQLPSRHIKSLKNVWGNNYFVK
jgi:hypothetical protein